MKINLKNFIIGSLLIAISFYSWNNTKEEVSIERKLQAITSNTYQTNQNRTENVKKYCQGLDRNNLVDKNELD